MRLPELVAFLMLGGMLLYVLLAGADFGAGVWDLFAFGPRAKAQRKLIEHALAPVWEANHVWLIFVIVLLFTAFPSAYSAATTALHVPLTAMLFGIVLRGAAFVFRQYGHGDVRDEMLFGRIFAVASTMTPVFLGATLAAITGGEIRLKDGMPTTGFYTGWVGSFPLLVGLLTLSLFALLAAVYLSFEARGSEVEGDFVLRALIAQGVAFLFAMAAALGVGQRALLFRDKLLGSAWTLPLFALTSAAAVGCIFALLKRKLWWARACVIAQVSLIVLGWGLAQFPYLIAPDLTVAIARAPDATLTLLVPAVIVGTLLLTPCLYVLFRVFKQG